MFFVQPKTIFITQAAENAKITWPPSWPNTFFSFTSNLIIVSGSAIWMHRFGGFPSVTYKKITSSIFVQERWMATSWVVSWTEKHRKKKSNNNTYNDTGSLVSSGFDIFYII